MRQVDWNEVNYSEFCQLAMLNEDERYIMETRIMKTATVYQQSDHFNCSDSKVRDMVRNLKDRYDAVQPLSQHMPVRKLSKKEMARYNRIHKPSPCLTAGAFFYCRFSAVYMSYICRS